MSTTQSEPSGSPRPRGRRPGNPEHTRVAILDAARRAFATSGYERATLRAIARDAGVDPALVIHHFGNKEGLFAAAHELPFDPTAVLDGLAHLPRDQRGHAIAHTFLHVVCAPGSPAASLIVAAATHEAAARSLREFFQGAIVEHGRPFVIGPDADLRLALISAHLIGIAAHRLVVGLPALAERPLDDLVAAIAPTIQRYLDGPWPPPD